jgi:hypothetical protein
LTINTGDDTPLRVLFPQYWKLDSMVRGEIAGLSDAQIDWTNYRYGWAGWSIRQQSSHLASVVYRWLLVRWREQLFAGGIPITNDRLRQVNSERHDRRLDDDLFRTSEQILGAMEEAMQIAQSVLRRVTVGEGRTLVVTRASSPQWAMMTQAHPHGVTVTPDGGTLTLEATFRHMYFEYITHMFNMQRMKRAQGLPVIVRLPNEGYHTVPGWDVTEA